MRYLARTPAVPSAAPAVRAPVVTSVAIPGAGTPPLDRTALLAVVVDAFDAANGAGAWDRHLRDTEWRGTAIVHVRGDAGQRWVYWGNYQAPDRALQDAQFWTAYEPTLRGYRAIGTVEVHRPTEQGD